LQTIKIPSKTHGALRDFALSQVTGIRSVIKKPRIEANNFEIKLELLQMIQTSVQFYGLPSDDPNAHIASFLEICDTFKHNGVTDDAIRLRLFMFSLRDRAKSWLNSMPACRLSHQMGRFSLEIPY